MERNTRIEEELFPFYALDSLTDEERSEVERYMAGNPAAAARLALLAEAVTEFGAATGPLTPSPAVKSGLMARIEADHLAGGVSRDVAVPVRPVAPPPQSKVKSPSPSWLNWWRSFAPAIGAFAVVALLLTAAAIWQQSRRIDELQARIAVLEQSGDSLQTRIGELETENSGLKQQLSARDDLLASYSTPGTVTVAIGDVTGDHPAAVGTLTVDPARESAILRVANLPPLDPGSTYQAWVIVGETPISAGLFNVDEQGFAIHELPPGLPTEYDAVGVSMEPASGSETPTQENIILLGASF